MRIILAVTFFMQLLLSYSQDTLYYDYEWNEVSSSKEYKYLKVLKPSEDNPDEILEQVFYRSGGLRYYKFYSSYKNQILEGSRKEWYENGQIRKDLKYNNGKLDGEVVTYYENGQKKRHDLYDEGTFLEGKCWTSSGIETKHFDYFVMSEFPGGINQLVRFVASNTRYPNKSKKQGIQGVVIVNFTVDKYGNVTNINILNGLNTELNNEAMRVVKKMPKWEPGMEDGELINVDFNLPFSFKLESTK